MNHHIPKRNVDPYTLSNDREGYSVYGFVLMASEPQQESVQKIRDAVRVERSMLPAHVTVKGPISDVPSLAEVQRIVSEITETTSALRVEFDGTPRARRLDNGETLATQAIKVTPELSDLHERLLIALDPVSATAYRSEDVGVYGPHLTIYHEPLPELESHGEKLLETFDIGDGFDAHAIHVFGHSGTPFRGKWALLSVHKLVG